MINNVELKKNLVIKKNKDDMIVLNNEEIPKLYHYTTLEGFNGLIQSKSLRLTNVNYQNDEAEY